MKTYNRICIKETHVDIGQGKTYTLKRGVKYLTDGANKKGIIMVFAIYWLTVSAEIFAEAEIFNKFNQS